MQPLWLNNLKKWATGTAAGSKQCLDVNIAQSVALTTTAPTPTAYKERRFHDAALTTIPAIGSNPVQLNVLGAASPADIANTCTEVGINWNGGAAIEILVGATAGSAVAKGAVGAGQTRSFGLPLVAGDKVWVRAVQAATITVGELMVTFLG